MLRKTLIGIMAASTAAAWTPLAAETLIIDEMQQSQSVAASRPSRGMTKTRVASNWGEPASRRGPVGEPPISRWEYPGFVVFFEYDHVIHTVARN